MQENISLAELRAEAKARGLRGISGLKKQELIDLLNANQEEQRVHIANREERTESGNRNDLRRVNSMERPRRQDSREDRRQDNREDRRQDNREDRRQDNRGDRRQDNRGDRRQDSREDRRQGVREDRRQDIRRQESRDFRRQDNRDMRRQEDREVRRAEDREVRRSEDREVRRAENREDRNTENRRVYMDGWNTGTRAEGMTPEDMRSLDSGVEAYGILEIVPDGYGFIRGENFLSTDEDIYVSHAQIRRFNMKTGDVLRGSIRVKTGSEKFAALLYVSEINGEDPSVAEHRKNFEDLTPIFPREKICLEYPGCSPTMRILDLISPIGKGQRGMIVSPPKAGKTSLMKEIAGSVQRNHPEIHIIILLIDERPEEVTDIKEAIYGDNVEVIYSTFDELPDHHRAVSEMVIGRAKRLVEHGKDVIILLDSITRLARAYNMTVTPSGRTLSGGLDPAALHMPKKFFGAARNTREGGSLTILATALVDTGSRMDDVVFEEFKGTGNMEVVLDRKLSERRIFPAIDLAKSGTRREDLLLSEEEMQAVRAIRKGLAGMKQEEAVEQVLDLFTRTRDNREFVEYARKIRL